MPTQLSTRGKSEPKKKSAPVSTTPFTASHMCCYEQGQSMLLQAAHNALLKHKRSTTGSELALFFLQNCHSGQNASLGKLKFSIFLLKLRSVTKHKRCNNKSQLCLQCSLGTLCLTKNGITDQKLPLWNKLSSPQECILHRFVSLAWCTASSSLPGYNNSTVRYNLIRQKRPPPKGSKRGVRLPQLPKKYTHLYTPMFCDSGVTDGPAYDVSLECTLIGTGLCASAFEEKMPL